MSGDKQEKDRTESATEEVRGKRSFIDHLLNQPEGPETPRAKVEPRDVEF